MPAPGGGEQTKAAELVAEGIAAREQFGCRRTATPCRRQTRRKRGRWPPRRHAAMVLAFDIVDLGAKRARGGPAKQAMAPAAARIGLKRKAFHGRSGGKLDRNDRPDDRRVRHRAAHVSGKRVSADPLRLIMPLAGYTAAKGEANIVLVILAGTCGSLAGAFFWYGLGRLFDHERLKSFADRHGRIITMTRADLTKADDWFDDLWPLRGAVRPADPDGANADLDPRRAVGDAGRALPRLFGDRHRRSGRRCSRSSATRSAAAIPSSRAGSTRSPMASLRWSSRSMFGGW